MVVGSGVDQVEVRRIRSLFADHRERLSRIFTEGELVYCRGRREMFQRLAAIFAAKEAVFKAIGTGLRGKMRWTDVEVVRDARGCPAIRLSGETRAVVDRQGVTEVLVSMTYGPEYAIAQILLVAGQPAVA